MRLVHLSDIHYWRLGLRARDLLSKRVVGAMSLLMGRGRMFRLERAPAVYQRVLELEPDHILITGDLTTTSSAEEFLDARTGLTPLLRKPDRVTIIPGNHDRYTQEADRAKRFEATFGTYMPQRQFPWLRWLDEETLILGLDPCRPDVSARGMLPSPQFAAAHQLMMSLPERPRRIIIACHYPLSSPPMYAMELAPKRMVNAEHVASWLSTFGPHLYCCGHVHVAWVFHPPEIPGQLCINPGAPLLRDANGYRPPGFMEIELVDSRVTTTHHFWDGSGWRTRVLYQNADFFPPIPVRTPRPVASSNTIPRP